MTATERAELLDTLQHVEARTAHLDELKQEQAEIHVLLQELLEHRLLMASSY